MNHLYQILGPDFKEKLDIFRSAAVYLAKRG